MRQKGVLIINKAPLPVADQKFKMEADLEDALDLAGVGKYQVFHCLLMLATLAAAVLEMIGTAFILPAAACDLDLPESLRGIVTSIPNIGVILTAPFWGRAADSRGRKPVLLFTTAAAGVIGLVAALMPSLLSYALCKFFGSMFLACPSSLGFAYAGELVPRRRRDIAVLACNGLLMLSSTFSPRPGVSLVAGALVPRRRRDIAVLACNGLLMLSSTFSPLLAWGILAGDWRYQLGSLTLRPWRLLTAVYAAPLILTALWMTQAQESPKFLMAKGRNRQALEVLRRIHARNSGLEPDSFCVTSLKESDVDRDIAEDGSEAALTAKRQESALALLRPPHAQWLALTGFLMFGVFSLETNGTDIAEDGSEAALTAKRQESALALLRPPHVQWLALTGFLMFGVFSLLNGLFLFAADTVNKVMQGSSQDEGTICVTMNQAVNQTSTGCVDSISHDTFLIMVVTTVVYGVVVLVASLCPLSKKTLLVSMFSVVGVACLLSGTLTNRKVAGVAMSALQLTSLGIGPLTAYAVHLFPTSLRGTAVGAVLMCGRVGSVVGANAAGILLAAACSATFYIFAVLLFVCAGLSFLLPKEEQAHQDPRT